MQLELASLLKGKDCYYEILNRRNDDKTCLLIIFFDDARLDAKAEQLKLKVKLRDYDCKVSFKCNAAECFVKFNARDNQTIIDEIISEELETDTLIHSGVILDTMNLHDLKKRKLMEKCIQDNIWGLVFGFINTRFRAHTKALDYVADYYGEKTGFYFAWLIHYTSWLLIPSVVGAIIYAIQVINYLSRDEIDATEFIDATDTVLNVIYSIFVALWTTFFVESWKRK